MSSKKGLKKKLKGLVNNIPDFVANPAAMMQFIANPSVDSSATAVFQELTANTAAADPAALIHQLAANAAAVDPASMLQQYTANAGTENPMAILQQYGAANPSNSYAAQLAQNYGAMMSPNPYQNPYYPNSTSHLAPDTGTTANAPKFSQAQAYPYTVASNAAPAENTHPIHSAQQVGNAAFLGPQPPAPPARTGIIPAEILEQIYTRPYSAKVKLGTDAVEEACKGLSRILRAGNDADIQLFGMQLRNKDRAAVASDYRACLSDRIPCFAVSYVQSQTVVVGRFKFSPSQWGNFHTVLREVRKSGVDKCRVWLDQCLWIRDASQGAWAHTGILPYVLWPVLSLGIRVIQTERSKATYDRMWPFVEEVAGLWSLGVIMTSEFRDKRSSEGDVRECLSFNHRVKLEPESSLEMLLLNIYHGAADGLRTGWQEDVEELKEMAKWNIECVAEDVIVGLDWRARIAQVSKRNVPQIIGGIGLSQENIICGYNLGGVNLYLDGSRKVAVSSWHGAKEWVSGNEIGVPSETELMLLGIGGEMYNVVTDKGEFQVLKTGTGGVVWLLVAMDGRTSGYTRGKVAWTKVMSGYSSCLLPGGISSGDFRVLAQALREQVGVDIRIISGSAFQGRIEWQ